MLNNSKLLPNYQTPNITKLNLQIKQLKIQKKTQTHFQNQITLPQGKNKNHIKKQEYKMDKPTRLQRRKVSYHTKTNQTDKKNPTTNSQLLQHHHHARNTDRGITTN